MGRSFRGGHGGIFGLLDLPREHWEAIEADLLTRGFLLSDVPHRLSWRALKAFAKHADRSSALYRVTVGPGAAWDAGEYMLAILVDLASAELYSKTRDAKSGRNRPKPLRRPGDAPDPDETRYGDASETVEEIGDWLRKRRERQLRAEAVK